VRVPTFLCMKFGFAILSEHKPQWCLFLEGVVWCRAKLREERTPTSIYILVGDWEVSCVLFVLTVGFYIVVSRCTKEGHSCNVPFLSDVCVLFLCFLGEGFVSNCCCCAENQKNPGHIAGERHPFQERSTFARDRIS